MQYHLSTNLATRKMIQTCAFANHPPGSSQHNIHLRCSSPTASSISPPPPFIQSLHVQQVPYPLPLMPPSVSGILPICTHVPPSLPTLDVASSKVTKGDHCFCEIASQLLVLGGPPPYGSLPCPLGQYASYGQSHRL